MTNFDMNFLRYQDEINEQIVCKNHVLVELRPEQIVDKLTLCFVLVARAHGLVLEYQVYEDIRLPLEGDSFIAYHHPNVS